MDTITVIKSRRFGASMTNSILQENHELFQDNSLSFDARGFFGTIETNRRQGKEFKFSKEHKSMLDELKASKYAQQLKEKFGENIFKF